MYKMHNAVFIFLTLGLLLSACGGAAVPTEASPQEQAAPSPSAPPTDKLSPRPLPTLDVAMTHRSRASASPSPSPTSTLMPTVMSTPSSTSSTTPYPTATAPPALTPTASPTLQTFFPMSIAGMRQGSYPGSDIVLDEELTAAVDYRRYYVYYLSQGLKIYALLTVPEGDAPRGGWPGIIFNHGYIAPNEYRTTQQYVDYINRLARSDYVVFSIDYRGHGNSEGDPQGAYGDPGYQVDLLNALASLKRYADVNPQKIGMWGHSMGGYLGLRSMVISQDFKVGVIWAGVVGAYPALLNDWPAGPLIPPVNSRKWMEDWPAQFGAPEQNPEFWDSISANSYLADLSGPLQLHYGTQDEYAPTAFSETLAEQVRAAGREVEIHSYPGDNHNLTGFFNLAMDRTIAFFDAVLK